MEALILNGNPENIKQLSKTEKLPGLLTKGPCRAGLEGRIALARRADHSATLPSLACVQTSPISFAARVQQRK